MLLLLLTHNSFLIEVETVWPLSLAEHSQGALPSLPVFRIGLPTQAVLAAGLFLASGMGFSRITWLIVSHPPPAPHLST